MGVLWMESGRGTYSREKVILTASTPPLHIRSPRVVSGVPVVSAEGGDGGGALCDGGVKEAAGLGGPNLNAIAYHVFISFSNYGFRALAVQ